MAQGGSVVAHYVAGPGGYPAGADNCGLVLPG